MNHPVPLGSPGTVWYPKDSIEERMTRVLSAIERNSIVAIQSMVKQYGRLTEQEIDVMYPWIEERVEKTDPADIRALDFVYHLLLNMGMDLGDILDLLNDRPSVTPALVDRLRNAFCALSAKDRADCTEGYVFYAWKCLAVRVAVPNPHRRRILIETATQAPDQQAVHAWFARHWGHLTESERATVPHVYHPPPPPH